MTRSARSFSFPPPLGLPSPSPLPSCAPSGACLLARARARTCWLAARRVSSLREMQTDFAFMTNYWRDLKPPPVNDAVAQPRDPARKASGEDEDEDKDKEEAGRRVTRFYIKIRSHSKNVGVARRPGPRERSECAAWYSRDDGCPRSSSDESGVVVGPLASRPPPPLTWHATPVERALDT